MSIAFVQAATLTGFGTLVLAYPAPNTAANFLSLGQLSLGATVAPTDTNLNSWNNLDQVNGAALATGLGWSFNCTAGANTVISGSGTAQLSIEEHSGVDPAGTIDQSAKVGGVTSNAPSSGPITTSIDNELLIGVCGANGPVKTAGVGWTERGNGQYLILEDQVALLIGTFSATCSLDSGATWMALIASFPGISAPPIIINLPGSSLEVGVVSQLTNDAVYELPDKQVRLFTDAVSPVIRASNNIEMDPNITLTLDINQNVELACAFIQPTSGDLSVRIVSE